ncbi:unnamed protein product [Urochloa humidicola]
MTNPQQLGASGQRKMAPRHPPRPAPPPSAEGSVITQGYEEISKETDWIRFTVQVLVLDLNPRFLFPRILVC